MFELGCKLLTREVLCLQTHVAATKKGPSDTSSLQNHDAGERAGLKCLQDGGIGESGLKMFEDSTVCVGWEIKRHVGIGQSGKIITVHGVSLHLSHSLRSLQWHGIE